MAIPFLFKKKITFWQVHLKAVVATTAVVSVAVAIATVAVAVAAIAAAVAAAVAATCAVPGQLGSHLHRAWLAV